MSGYLTETELARWKDDANKIFETLSNGRTVTIVKEPRKVLVSQGQSPSNVFGFGDKQKDPIYTFVPESKTFPCIMVYPKTDTAPLSPDANIRVEAGANKVKVNKECRDYIVNGITKQIETDEGRVYYLDGIPQRQMFLSDEYYLVTLKGTK